MTVRYGTIPQQVTAVSDSEISVSSPSVSVPDAVTVSVSLNGQQFIADKTLHYRDHENTFTYTQDFLITEYAPKGGPISGKTRLRVQGLGIKRGQEIWVRFRDASTS